MRSYRVAAIAAALLTAGSLALAVPAEAAPAAKKHIIKVVASTELPATITYAGNGVVVQKKDYSGSFSRSFVKRGYGYYSVSVSSWDGGAVSCKIIRDGKTIRSKKANGDYSSVNCSYMG